MLAAITGMVLGLVLTWQPQAFALASAAVALVLLVLVLLRHPQITVTIFWTAFCLQGTLFVGSDVQGLYFPIYFLLLATVIIRVVHRTLPRAPLLMIAYAIFLAVILLSMFSSAYGLDFGLWQRVFVYVLGILTFFQFRSRASLSALPPAMITSSLIIAGWLILQSSLTTLDTRGGISSGQNTISLIICLGVIPLAASIFSATKLFGARTLLLWLLLGVQAWALLLLASRGIMLALTLTLLFMLLRQPRRLLPILTGLTLALVTVLAAPGTDALWQRLQTADLASANDRLPLWKGTLEILADSNIPDFVLGHGFDSSKQVVSNINPYLTSTHNGYLQLLFEFGALGLASFLLLNALALSVFRRGNRWQQLALPALILFLLIANLNATVTDSVLYWITLGYVLAAGATGSRRTGHVPVNL